MPEAIRIDEACRAAGSRFILSETFGVFGYTFCDFGNGFVCVDTNGEEPTSAMVASIDNSNADMGGETLVTCLDEARHGLEDGACVPPAAATAAAAAAAPLTLHSPSDTHPLPLLPTQAITSPSLR